MLRKFYVILLMLVVMFSMCGCDFFTTDIAELLTPPTLSDDLKQISAVIKKSAGEKYNFEYPQEGEYHSAVVQNDINGDGENEAFAFYSVTDGEIETMSINVVCKDKNEWKSFGSQSIVGSGVQMVDFCDLDHDGTSEILVGWQIYGTSEMQLAVYTFKDNNLTQRMLNRYSHFITCNLDENNLTEILIIDADANKSQNTATLYALTEKGVVQVGRCPLDSKVQTFGKPFVAELSTGKNAVYIDSQKGIGAITEVLVYENGKLSNPLYDEQSKETSQTLRSSNFSTRDFNGDDILEIPVQLNVPSVSKSAVAEKLYLTVWCSFNGEILTPQLTTMINTIDGYYYTLPTKWIGKIAILKDTDTGVREIYSYNTDKMAAEKSLIYLRAFNKKDWEKGIYAPLGLEEIGETESLVIACRISSTAKKSGITVDSVKKNFGIYTQE